MDWLYCLQCHRYIDGYVTTELDMTAKALAVALERSLGSVLLPDPCCECCATNTVTTAKNITLYRTGMECVAMQTPLAYFRFSAQDGEPIVFDVVQRRLFPPPSKDQVQAHFDALSQAVGFQRPPYIYHPKAPSFN